MPGPIVVGKYYRFLNPHREWDPLVRVVQTTLVEADKRPYSPYHPPSTLDHLVHKCEIKGTIPDECQGDHLINDDCKVYVTALTSELDDGSVMPAIPRVYAVNSKCQP